jgi:glycosyltransferase involved in cell wall biosynthesis
LGFLRRNVDTPLGDGRGSTRRTLPMHLSKEDITVVVTVHRRLDYLRTAIGSAVNQTLPVRVVLLDNGAADAHDVGGIVGSFGPAVEWHRNPVVLPIFANMNRAIALCGTQWLSILHDDDLLEADFVENLCDAALRVEGCALFCGGTIFIDEAGDRFFRTGLPPAERVRMLGVEDFAYENKFSFPGHLMDVGKARAVGGFPPNSSYTGDWDLWFRLAMAGGVSMLGADVASYRSHGGHDRGTNAVGRSGRTAACRAMQCKRNLSRLRAAGIPARFDRALFLERNRPTYRETLLNVPRMHRWLLTYSRRILMMAKPESRYGAMLTYLLRNFGITGLRIAGIVAAIAEGAGFRFRHRL